VTLSLIGGLVGVTLGIGAAMAIASFAGWHISISPEAVVLAVAFAFVIGVFSASTPPARRRGSTRSRPAFRIRPTQKPSTGANPTMPPPRSSSAIPPIEVLLAGERKVEKLRHRQSGLGCGGVDRRPALRRARGAQLGQLLHPLLDLRRLLS
jgi:hypothetical protein